MKVWIVFRSCVCCFLVLLVGCDFWNDGSVPKGVKSQEVEHVSRTITYNEHVRPLLYQLTKQGDRSAAVCRKIAEGATGEKELMLQLEREGTLLCSQSPEAKTILWRWAQDGAVREPSWLASPLKVGRSKNAQSATVRSELAEKLSRFWLEDIESPEESRSLDYEQWVKEVFLSGQNYRAILTALLSSLDAEESTMERLPSQFFVSSNEVLKQKVETLLGLSLTENTHFTAAQLSETGSLPATGFERLFQPEVLKQYQDLKLRYNRVKEELSQQLNLRSTMDDWFRESPAFVELRMPFIQKEFEEKSFPRGRLGRGLKVTSEATLLHSQQDVLGTYSLAFWFKAEKSHALSLSWEKSGGYELKILENRIELSSGEKRPHVVTRVPWIAPDEWNCFVLNYDQSRYGNECEMYLNGIKIYLPVYTQEMESVSQSYGIALHGAGAVDQLSYYPFSLTQLERSYFYDDRLAARAFRKKSAELIQHLNVLSNPDYASHRQELMLLANQLRRLSNEAVLVNLPKRFVLNELFQDSIEERDFKLDAGTHKIGDQVVNWLFTHSESRLARTTVNWVSLALNQRQLFDPSFPERRLPNQAGFVDELAAELIELDWDIHWLANELLNRTN